MAETAPSTPACPACGYDLRATPTDAHGEGTCPECGGAFNPATLRSPPYIVLIMKVLGLSLLWAVLALAAGLVVSIFHNIRAAHHHLLNFSFPGVYTSGAVVLVLCLFSSKRLAVQYRRARCYEKPSRWSPLGWWYARILVVQLSLAGSMGILGFFGWIVVQLCFVYGLD